MHSLLLDDPELLHGIEDLIRKGLYGANYALRLQRHRLAAVFAGMDDSYFRNRIDDIDHVNGRLHAALHKRDVDVHGVTEDVLVSENVASSALPQLQSRGAVAIVTPGGSAPSHRAFL